MNFECLQQYIPTFEMDNSWICKWCEYPNKSLDQVCILCNERTESHTNVQIVNLESRTIQFEDFKRSPEFKPRVIRESKEYNPPTRTSNSNNPPIKPNDTNPSIDYPSDKHVCCCDTDSVYCLICQKPMFLSFASNHEYPAGIRKVIYDKVSVLDNIFDERVYSGVLNELNGPPLTSEVHYHSIYIDGEFVSSIVEKDNPMCINFTIDTSARIVYIGPSTKGLKNIFAKVVREKQPAVLRVVIENNQINDREDEFLAIYPTGKVYLIDASLSACTYSHIEDFLVKLCSDITLESGKSTLQFVRHANWHRTCIRQSPTYINFSSSPMWRPLMHIMLMSMVALGFTINNAIAFLVTQDKQTMVLLLDVIVERLIAFALSLK